MATNGLTDEEVLGIKPTGQTATASPPVSPKPVATDQVEPKRFTDEEVMNPVKGMTDEEVMAPSPIDAYKAAAKRVADAEKVLSESVGAYDAFTALPLNDADEPERIKLYAGAKNAQRFYNDQVVAAQRLRPAYEEAIIGIKEEETASLQRFKDDPVLAPYVDTFVAAKEKRDQAIDALAQQNLSSEQFEAESKKIVDGYVKYVTDTETQARTDNEQDTILLRDILNDRQRAMLSGGAGKADMTAAEAIGAVALGTPEYDMLVTMARDMGPEYANELINRNATLRDKVRGAAAYGMSEGLLGGMGISDAILAGINAITTGPDTAADKAYELEDLRKRASEGDQQASIELKKQENELLTEGLRSAILQLPAEEMERIRQDFLKKKEEDRLGGLPPERRQRIIDTSNKILDSFKAAIEEPDSAKAYGTLLPNGTLYLTAKGKMDSGLAIDKLVESGEVPADRSDYYKQYYQKLEEDRDRAMRGAAMETTSFKNWLADNPEFAAEVATEEGAKKALDAYAESNNTYLANAIDLVVAPYRGLARGVGGYFQSTADGVRLSRIAADPNLSDEEKVDRFLDVFADAVARQPEQVPTTTVAGIMEPVFETTGSYLAQFAPVLGLKMLGLLIPPTKGLVKGAMPAARFANVAQMALIYGAQGAIDTMDQAVKESGYASIEEIQQKDPELAKQIYERGQAAMIDAAKVSVSEQIPMEKFLGTLTKRIKGPVLFRRAMDAFVFDPLTEISQEVFSDLTLQASQSRYSAQKKDLEMMSLGEIAQMYFGVLPITGATAIGAAAADKRQERIDTLMRELDADLQNRKDAADAAAQAAERAAVLAPESSAILRAAAESANVSVVTDAESRAAAAQGKTAPETRTIADSIKDKDTFQYQGMRGAITEEDGEVVFREFGTQKKYIVPVAVDQTIAEIEELQWLRRGQQRQVTGQPIEPTVVPDRTPVMELNLDVSQEEFDSEPDEVQVPAALVEIEAAPTLNFLADLFDTGDSIASQQEKAEYKSGKRKGETYTKNVEIPVTELPEYYRQVTPEQLDQAKRLIDGALRLIDSMEVNEATKDQLAEHFLLLDQDITNYEQNPEYQKYRQERGWKVSAIGETGEVPTTLTETEAAERELEQRVRAEAESAERRKTVPARAAVEAPEVPQGARIRAAAYVAPDGTIYTADTHLNAMQKAADAGKITQADIAKKQKTVSRETPEFGFSTDAEPFVTRDQAENIAKTSGQLLVETPETGRLHSNEVALDEFNPDVDAPPYIARAIVDRSPISVEDVDRAGVELPKGWKIDGDLYVYVGKEEGEGKPAKPIRKLDAFSRIYAYAQDYIAKNPQSEEVLKNKVGLIVSLLNKRDLFIKFPSFFQDAVLIGVENRMLSALNRGIKPETINASTVVRSAFSDAMKTHKVDYERKTESLTGDNEKKRKLDEVLSGKKVEGEVKLTTEEKKTLTDVKRRTESVERKLTQQQMLDRIVSDFEETLTEDEKLAFNFIKAIERLNNDPKNKSKRRQADAARQLLEDNVEDYETIIRSVVTGFTELAERVARQELTPKAPKVKQTANGQKVAAEQKDRVDIREATYAELAKTENLTEDERAARVKSEDASINTVGAWAKTITDPKLKRFLNFIIKNSPDLANLPISYASVLDGKYDAFFDPTIGSRRIVVALNPTKEANLLIAHEVIHSVTLEKSRFYDRGEYEKLTAGERRIFEQLDKIRNELRIQLGKGNKDFSDIMGMANAADRALVAAQMVADGKIGGELYALVNMGEFLANVIDNKAFQQSLDQIDPNIFRQIWNFIRQLFYKDKAPSAGEDAIWQSIFELSKTMKVSEDVTPAPSFFRLPEYGIPNAPILESKSDLNGLIDEAVLNKRMTADDAVQLKIAINILPDVAYAGVQVLFTDKLTRSQSKALDMGLLEKLSTRGIKDLIENVPIIYINTSKAKRNVARTFLHENAHFIMDEIIDAETLNQAREIYDSLPISRQSLFTAQYSWGGDTRFAEWFAEGMADYYESKLAEVGVDVSTNIPFIKPYKKIFDLFSGEKAKVDAFFDGLDATLSRAKAEIARQAEDKIAPASVNLRSNYMNAVKNGDYLGAKLIEEDAINRVLKVLTPDLLKKEYIEANKTNATYGHCYAASEAIYYLLGGKAAGLVPVTGRDANGVSHRWLRSKDGRIIDATATQYTSVGLNPPYENGRGGGFTPPGQAPPQTPSKRAQIIIDRVNSPETIAPSYAGVQANVPQFMRDSLSVAQMMAVKGEKPETIRSVTGWIVNPYDKQLRWEIPDNDAKFTSPTIFANAASAFEKGDTGEQFVGKLSDVLDHPALYSAYPELKNVEVFMAYSLGGASAEFRPRSEKFKTPDEIAISYRAEPQKVKPSILHEIQHIIQNTEGFAEGGNLELAARQIAIRSDVYRKAKEEHDLAIKNYEAIKAARVKELEEETGKVEKFNETYAEIAPEVLKARNEVSKAHVKSVYIRQIEAFKVSYDQSLDAYRSFAGEIEARDTAARISLTPEERRTIAPYSGENISPEDAIVIQKVAPSAIESDKRKLSPEEYATYLEGLTQEARDNIEVSENFRGFGLYEARQIAAKMQPNSTKFKKISDKYFVIDQDWDYIANVNGVPYGLVKEEDPDDEDLKVWAYGKVGTNDFNETVYNVGMEEDVVREMQEDLASKTIAPAAVQIPPEEGGTLPPATSAKLEELGVRPDETTVVGTEKTYANILKTIIRKGISILDFGSGLGHGLKLLKDEAKRVGFEAFGYEPMWRPDRKAAAQAPDYIGFESLDLIPDNSQDYIINNAVLNVTTEDIRADIVKQMYNKLKVGGTLFLQARSWNNVKSLLKNSRNIIVGPREIFVPHKQTFQKGFTSQELINFVQSQLPDAKIVRTQFGDIGIAVTKPKVAPETSIKTLAGTTIKRYKNLVGKQVGEQIYVHKNYASEVIPADLLDKAPSNFTYNTVMYNTKTGAIRFDEAPDFDTAREPRVGNYVTINPDGTQTTGKSESIWHHKWLWVKDDYAGFDVAQSKNWSRQWLSKVPEVAKGTVRSFEDQLKKYNVTEQDIAPAAVVPKISKVNDEYDGSRVGTATQGKVKETNQETNVSIDTVKPENLAKQMAGLNNFISGVKLPTFITSIKDPVKKRDAFIDFVADNLLALYEAFPVELRAAATRWYDGARKLAEGISRDSGLSVEQAGGIMAAFSPMKDWFQNVEMAIQFSKIYKNHLKTKITASRFAEAFKEITQSSSQKARRGRIRLLAQLEGRTIDGLWKEAARNEARARKIQAQRGLGARDFNALPESKNAKKLRMLASWATRVVATQEYGLDFNVYSPDGAILGKKLTKDETRPKKMVWQSATFIEKALSIAYDGSAKNISNNLGSQHKIRSFYNNIVAPNSSYGDTTIDTHAVNAGVLFPMGNKGKLVSDAFGQAGVAGGGNSGIYWLFREAYVRAAARARVIDPATGRVIATGIQPRQMQSITWEAIRGLFPDDVKRKKSFVEEIANIWKNAPDARTARKRIVSRELRLPDWASAYTGDGGGAARAVARARGSARSKTDIARGLRNRVRSGDYGIAPAAIDPNVTPDPDSKDNTPNEAAEISRARADAKIGQESIVGHSIMEDEIPPELRQELEATYKNGMTFEEFFNPSTIALDESYRPYAIAIWLDLNGGLMPTIKLKDKEIAKLPEGSPEQETVRMLKRAFEIYDKSSDAVVGGKEITYSLNDIVTTWFRSGLSEAGLRNAILQFTNLNVGAAITIADDVAKQYELQKKIADSRDRARVRMDRALPAVTLRQAAEKERMIRLEQAVGTIDAIAEAIKTAYDVNVNKARVDRATEKKQIQEQLRVAKKIIREVVPREYLGGQLVTLERAAGLDGLKKVVFAAQDALNKARLDYAVSQARKAFDRAARSVRAGTLTPEAEVILRGFVEQYTKSGMSDQTKAQIQAVLDEFTNDPINALQRLTTTKSGKQVYAIDKYIKRKGQLNAIRIDASLGLDALRDIAALVNSTIHMDKMAKGEMVFNKKMKRDEWKRLIIGEIDKIKTITKEKEGFGPVLGGFKWQAIFKGARVENILRGLGMENMRKLIYEDLAVDAYNDELRNRIGLKKKIEAAVKEFTGLEIGTKDYDNYSKELFEVAGIDQSGNPSTIKVRRSELIDMSASLMDANNFKKAVRAGGYVIDRLRGAKGGDTVAITPASYQQIQSTLSQADTDMVNFLVGIYNNELFTLLNDSSIQTYGHGIKKTSGIYYPRNAFAWDRISETSKDLDYMEYYNSRVDSVGHLKERTDEVNARLVAVDYLTRLDYHVTNDSRIAAYLPIVQDINSILRDSDVMRPLEIKVGENVVKQIREMVRQQTVPMPGLRDGLLNTLIGNAGVGVLGFKIHAALQNPAGIPIAMGYYGSDGFKYMMKAFGFFRKGWNKSEYMKMAEVLNRYTPYYAERYGEGGFIQEFTSGLAAGPSDSRWRKSMEDKSLSWLELSDKLGALVRYKTAQEVIKDRTDLKEGTPEFDRAVAREWNLMMFRSENTSHGADRTGFFLETGKNPALKLFMMFQSAVSKQYSLFAESVIQAQQGGRENLKEAAMKMAYVGASVYMSLAISSAFYGILFPPDEEEDKELGKVLTDLLGQLIAAPLSTIPVVGNTVQTAVTGFFSPDNQRKPLQMDMLSSFFFGVMDAANLAVKAGRQLTNDEIDTKTGDPRWWNTSFRAIEKGLNMAGIALRIPFGGLIQSGKFVKKLAESTWDGINGDLPTDEDFQKKAAKVRREMTAEPTTQEYAKLYFAVVEGNQKRFNRVLRDLREKNPKANRDSVIAAIRRRPEFLVVAMVERGDIKIGEHGITRDEYLSKKALRSSVERAAIDMWRTSKE